MSKWYDPVTLSVAHIQSIPQTCHIKWYMYRSIQEKKMECITFHFAIFPHLWQKVLKLTIIFLFPEVNPQSLCKCAVFSSQSEALCLKYTDQSHCSIYFLLTNQNKVFIKHPVKSYVVDFYSASQMLWLNIQSKDMGQTIFWRLLEGTDLHFLQPIRHFS